MELLSSTRPRVEAVVVGLTRPSRDVPLLAGHTRPSQDVQAPGNHSRGVPVPAVHGRNAAAQAEASAQTEASAQAEASAQTGAFAQAEVFAQVEAFVRAWGGTVLAVVDWPEEAASWLRQARRFAAGPPDAWVVAGAPLGWARMSTRLRQSTDWAPERTFGFASTARAVALVQPGTLEGMRGADEDGGVWRLGRNLIHRER
ncbi:hypothetical protein ACIBQX_30565 [Nonomuraea sp. NPDC049714]|uniref:hypothetical protein n=1 Tax=Nonomuraea sp. NPDC049714 TaxID=3364357 RepID=UPI00378E868B